MGAKQKCERKTTNLVCRNFTECQREYLQEKAEIATIERGYKVSESAMIAEIISENMKKEGFSCEIQK